MIAATAVEHEMTLVTRNGKDFGGLGVEIVNPWECDADGGEFSPGGPGGGLAKD
jgi:hypothetical protein